MSMTLEHAKKHRAQLLEMVQFTDAEIARLEAEQAAKPKLRHGDYGADADGPYIVLGKTVYWLEEDQVTSALGEHCTGRLGNILDDLKMPAEDMTEWDGGETYIPNLTLYANGLIELAYYGKAGRMSLSEAKSLARALLQIAATAERKAANAL